MSPEDRPLDNSGSARSDRDDTKGQRDAGEEATRVNGVELRGNRTTLKVVKPKNCTFNVHNVFYRQRANDRERMKQSPLSEKDLEERRKADEEKHQGEVDQRREAKRQRRIMEETEDFIDSENEGDEIILSRRSTRSGGTLG